MKIRPFAILVLPVALMFATAPQAADDKPSEPTYFPIKVGTTWSYKMGENRYTVTVAKIEDKDKQPCARLEMQARGTEKLLSVEYVAVKSDGVYRVELDDKKIDPPLCFLKLPIKANEEWKVSSTLGGMGKVEGTFKSGEMEKLEIGEKTYKNVVTASCKELQIGDAKIAVTYYFAPNVGMVKQVTMIDGKEVVIELEIFKAGS